jgi:hypothetical protein
MARSISPFNPKMSDQPGTAPPGPGSGRMDLPAAVESDFEIVTDCGRRQAQDLPHDAPNFFGQR